VFCENLTRLRFLMDRGEPPGIEGLGLAERVLEGWPAHPALTMSFEGLAERLEIEHQAALAQAISDTRNAQDRAAGHHIGSIVGPSDAGCAHKGCRRDYCKISFKDGVAALGSLNPVLGFPE
jgi:hypothetical protein